jgi:ankyrin repeat protein
MVLSGAQNLNPLVGTSGVTRVHATKLNRGATPAVLIQNPVVPFFDPFNHDFSNSNAVADCQAGTSYSGGWTALHAAAQATEAGSHGKTRPVQGDLDEMRFLLNGRGHHVPPEISFPHVSSPQVDINAAMTKSKYTPLHIAARSGHIEALSLLLQHSALCDATDYLGRTPLHHAAELGRADCLEEMLQNGHAGTVGLLKAHVRRAELVTVHGPDFSPRHRQGMELWVEMEVAQPPPLITSKQKTSVRVDLENLQWNHTLSFRCCSRDAKVTIRLMYRHAGMSKKEMDLVLGSFSCRLASAIEAAEQGEDATVLLDTPKQVMEREKREASKKAFAAAVAAADAASRPTPASKQGSFSRKVSGGSFRRVKSNESKKSAGSGKGEKKKKFLSLAGAVDAVIAANRIRRELATDDDDDDDQERDFLTLDAEFHPIINALDMTGRSALMLGAACGSMACTKLLLDAGADPHVRDVFGSTAASLAATAGHDQVSYTLHPAHCTLDCKP